MRPMTTSSSTPLTCRSAQLRRLMRRAHPFTDRVSIGVVRANTRPLACRLAHHHLQTRPGALKSSGRDPPRHLRLQPASRRPDRFSLVGAHSASATNASATSFARARSPSAMPSPFSGAIASSHLPEQFVQPATWWCVMRFARRSEYWRSTAHLVAINVCWPVA
jgi:hypothetical protein